MADTPLRFLDKTANRLYLLGALDGVDTSGMGAASALPTGPQVPIDAEVQYGEKALPVFGVVAVGGATGAIVVRPGQALNVAAELTAVGDVVVTCDPPANASAAPPWIYVYRLAGVGAGEPVSASGTSITFTAPGPGVWTPTVWVVSADGVSLPATGAPVTIGTPSTTAHKLSNLSGVITLPLLADHTYMITPITVTGSPVVRMFDQNGIDFSDFDGSTAQSVTIPTGVTQVTFAYWSDIAGSIDFQITEAGVQAPATLEVAASISGTLATNSTLTVTKAIYSDGTNGDYGAWSIQNFDGNGNELTVGTAATILLLPEWAGLEIQWTQFHRVADKIGPYEITVGPIAPGGAAGRELAVNGKALAVNGKALALNP